MKKLRKSRLVLEKLTLLRASQAKGGAMVWIAQSYDDGCSNSCNTCIDPADCGGEWYSAVMWDCL